MSVTSPAEFNRTENDAGVHAANPISIGGGGAKAMRPSSAPKGNAPLFVLRDFLPSSIRAKLLIVFLTLGAVTGLLGTYGIWQIRDVGLITARTFDRPLAAIDHARSAQIEFEELAGSTTGNQGEIGKIEAGPLEKNMLDDLDFAARRVASPEAVRLVGQTRELAVRWLKLRQSQHGFAAAHQGADLSSGPLSKELRHVFDDMGNQIASDGLDSRHVAIEASASALHSGVYATGISMIFALLMTLMMSRIIVAPLTAAAAVARRIADGDMETPILAKGKDEAAALLSSMASMQDRLLERRLELQLQVKVAMKAEEDLRLVHAELQLTAERLEESNRVLVMAGEIAQIGHYHRSLVSTASRWSDQLYRIHGLTKTADTIELDEVLKYIHPDDHAKLIEVDPECPGVLQKTEIRIIRPDGVRRDLVTWWQREQAQDGSIIGTFGVVQDITEQKNAECEREILNERMRLATEAGGFGIWEWSEYDELFVADKRLFELYGLEPKAGAISMDEMSRFMHPDDVERMRAVNANTHGKSFYDVEYRVIHPDGAVHHLRSCGSLVGKADDSGRWVGMVWDVTEQKNAEREREVLNERMRLAMDAGGFALWEWSAPDKSFVADKKLFELFGLQQDAGLIGMKEWLSCVHPDDAKQITSIHSSSMAGKNTYQIEYRIIRANGEIRHIRSRGSLFMSQTVNLQRWVGVDWDVTEQREAEREQAKLNERIRLATEAGKIGIWEHSIKEKTTMYDKRMFEIFGLEPTDNPDILEEFAKLVHPDDRKIADINFAAAINGERSYDTEFRIIPRQGEICHLRIKGSLQRDEAGNFERLLGIAWDVTELRLLTEQLHEEKEQLQITLSSIGDAVVATDAEARVIFINPVAEAIMGCSQKEIFGQPLKDFFYLIDDESNREVDSPVDRCIESRSIVKLEEGVSLISRDGNRYAIQDSVGPVLKSNGEIMGAVLVFQDVSRSREMQRALHYSASHDALTGLLNRAKFEKECQGALDLVRRTKATHALCFVDLDRFKLVNDTAGHGAGDKLLQEIAATMTSELRSTDVIARLGGDEFGLLLRDCPVEKALAVCLKLIATISAIRLAWDGKVHDVGASVGITMMTADSASLSELMSQADVACYASKHAGRNRASLYEEGQGEASEKHREIFQAANIRSAIDNDSFTLFAQEIQSVAPDQSEKRHIELLLRMVDEDGRIILPGALIPAAERHGLMMAIDRWVLREALIKMGPEIAKHPNLKIGINLSGNSIADPQMLKDMIEMIEMSPINPEAIQFEVTETAMMSHLSLGSKLANALREIGCTIALDDFGSGVSSFSYLKTFRADLIKIDENFVRNIHGNTTDFAIVESITDLAHRLGVKTVAESVESEEILAKLRSIGTDYAQGYAVSAPVALLTHLNSIKHAPTKKTQVELPAA